MRIENSPHAVYVKINDTGYITAVDSSDFLMNLANWIKVDEGYGDKYHHAQGNYFPKSIHTENGAFRYKMAGGVLEECTAEEIALQGKRNETPAVLKLEDRISMLESRYSEIKNTLTSILNRIVWDCEIFTAC